MTDSYNPAHSHIHEGVMMQWIRERNLDQLTVVPGLGRIMAEAIIEGTKNSEYPVNTAYSLLGK